MAAKWQPATNRRFNPPGGFGAFGTVQLFKGMARRKVSIRRADLGLSEPTTVTATLVIGPGFNPPGGFGAFGTPVIAMAERPN